MPQIKSLVEELRHEGWTFTYIGANQDVEAVAGSMGIRNSMAFEETPMGSKKMFDIDRRCRASFYKKIRLHIADNCCEEDTDYFETK